MRRIAYFDFYNRPAKVVTSGDWIPEVCEVYDCESGEFINRDDLTLDVISSHNSTLISEQTFRNLLEKMKH